MGTLSGFAYAQARIQARLAALPGEQEWERLAGSRTLSGFIEEARSGPMRPWIKGFSALSEPHAIERGLRALFRDLVDELACWVPERWREAVRWVVWLPVLPALGRVAGGGAMPAWIREDYELHRLLSDSGEPNTDTIAASGLADLASEPDADRVAERWLGEWRRRCAVAGRGSDRDLEAIVSRVRAHLGAFRGTGPERTWEQRQALRERFRLGFHRRPLRPVAVFLYLGILLIDLERLRAAMIERSLFDTSGSG